MEEKVAAHQHRMISEDVTLKTESLKSDNAVNSALHQVNKLHFKIYSNRKHVFKIVIIFHNFAVFTVICFTVVF